MKTLSQLTTEIIGDIWPSGEPEGLESAHRNAIQEGLAEISKWVECEQEGNVNIVQFCKTFFKCGMTVVPMPRGIIRNVFTVVGDNYCDPIFYREVQWPEPECLGRQVLGVVGTLPSGKPLPLGFVPAEASTDSTLGRARTGLWARFGGNIFIAPYIQSVEKVVFEWDGIKEQWADEDLINGAQDYKKALKMFLQYAHERDYGDLNRAKAFWSPDSKPHSGLFANALGDLMWQCAQERKTRNPVQRAQCRLLPSLEEKGLPPTPAAPAVFVHIANIGTPGSSATALAALVAALQPVGVFVSGINPISTDYATIVGIDYADFLSKSILWPAPSEQDWVLDDLVDYQDFFSLPNNERYYDLCAYPLHFFVIDGSDLEPDGKTLNSAQAQWLKAKMALSTAPWKVVVLAQVAQGSTNTPDPALAWPFKTWGADLVLSGGTVYERLAVGGLSYINAGACGSPTYQELIPAGTPYGGDITSVPSNAEVTYIWIPKSGERLVTTNLRNGGETRYSDQGVIVLSGSDGQLTVGVESDDPGPLIASSLLQMIPATSGISAGRISVTETSLKYERLDANQAVTDSVTLTK